MPDGAILSIDRILAYIFDCVTQITAASVQQASDSNEPSVIHQCCAFQTQGRVGRAGIQAHDAMCDESRDW